MSGKGSGAALALACLAAVGGAAAMTVAALPSGAGPLCGPACLDRRVEALLESDGSLPPAARPQARHLIQQELALSPFNTTAWLRLAALETDAQGGRLRGRGAEALSASYRYAPIDPEVALWRTAFVFNHWGDAPANVRTSAEREIRLLSARDPKAFAGLIRQIRDPSGALAYRMLVGVDDS
jgi:hypothetical protein